MSDTTHHKRHTPSVGIITRQKLIAMLRHERARAMEMLPDLPEDGCDYTRNKRGISQIDLILRRLRA